MASLSPVEARLGRRRGMSEAIEVSFTVSRANWLSSNQRLHWRAIAPRTQAIRITAKQQAVKVYRGEPLGKVQIVAEISYPTNAKCDPANAYPSVKAAVDGLRDAGWITDDDAKHVIGPDMRLGKKTGVKGLYLIRLIVIPINALERDRTSAGVQMSIHELPNDSRAGFVTNSPIWGDGRE